MSNTSRVYMYKGDCFSIIVRLRVYFAVRNPSYHSNRSNKTPMATAFEMEDDGTSHEIDISKNTLASDRVYCIVDI